MFNSVQDARAALAELFDGHDLELVCEALAPTLGFELCADLDGGCHLGGMPTMSPGIPWPVRRQLGNLDLVKARGGSSHAAHIAQFGGADVPFSFYAQIDCAEVHAAAPDISAPLPKTGRLLFFYDDQCGPWGDEDVSACVIHDDGPIADARVCEPPSALRAIEAELMAAWVVSMERANLDPASYAGPRMVYPERAISLRRMLALTDFMAKDLASHGELLARLDDADFHDSYIRWSAWHGGRFEGEGGGMRLHRMIGAPVCVQRDPRIHAVLAPEDPAWSNREVWADADWRDRLTQEALEWRLLLQIDLADLFQDRFAEGVVYFVIAAADLAAGNFSRVKAVYQQT